MTEEEIEYNKKQYIWKVVPFTGREPFTFILKPIFEFGSGDGLLSMKEVEVLNKKFATSPHKDFAIGYRNENHREVYANVERQGIEVEKLLKTHSL